jgi:hypothetical protein
MLMSKTASRPTKPVPVPAFDIESDVTHRVDVFSERAFSAERIAQSREEEEDPSIVATAEALSAVVTVDGASRSLEIKRGYRRRGVIAAWSETASLILDVESWPQFVALVNALDSHVTRVVAQNAVK